MILLVARLFLDLAIVAKLILFNWLQTCIFCILFWLKFSKTASCCWSSILLVAKKFLVLFFSVRWLLLFKLVAKLHLVYLQNCILFLLVAKLIMTKLVAPIFLVLVYLKGYFILYACKPVICSYLDLILIKLVAKLYFVVVGCPIGC